MIQLGRGQNLVIGPLVRMADGFQKGFVEFDVWQFQADLVLMVDDMSPKL